MKKNLRTILYFMLLALVATTFASCGDENDTIYGTLILNGQVTDIQGIPIAGAEIVLHNTGEGEYSKSAKTDADGNYSLLQSKCTEAVYISVEADGYVGDGISYELQFSDGVPGVNLGTADLNQNFSLHKQ